MGMGIVTLQDIGNAIDKKIMEDENEIIFSFYELRIRENLNKEETSNFLVLAKTRLENLNYSVYKTGQSYIYNGEERIVEENKLLVAIKNINKNI